MSDSFFPTDREGTPAAPGSDAVGFNTPNSHKVDSGAVGPDAVGSGEGGRAGGEESSKPKSASRGRSRIAQAGETLRDLARRSLALSDRPVSRLRKRKEPPPPAYGLDAELGQADRERLVEVVDGNNRPLLCMTPQAALRQKLPVRAVAVALRLRQNRLILRRRQDAGRGVAGRWDLYAGFVMVGEAREDAALRLLLSEAGLSGLRVSSLGGPEKDGDGLFTLFAVDLPAGLYPEHPVQDMMTVDADELAGLIRDVPELLSPELVRAAAVPGLFRV
mgnify:CR=1 FL=1